MFAIFAIQSQSYLMKHEINIITVMGEVMIQKNIHTVKKVVLCVIFRSSRTAIPVFINDGFNRSYVVLLTLFSLHFL